MFLDLSELDIPDLSDHEAIDIDAKRKERLNQRRGLFTASEFHKLMTVLNKPNELPAGAITYIRKKVAESLTMPSDTEQWQSPAMQWGNETEHQAVDAFIAKTGLDVQDCKDNQQFLQMGGYGGTPDGVIIDPTDYSITGLEIKCPDSHNHVFNLYNIEWGGDLLKHYPEYYWQVQGLMLITGADYWFFVSFDPRFIEQKHQLHIVKIDRHDGDIDLLTHRLALVPGGLFLVTLASTCSADHDLGAHAPQYNKLKPPIGKTLSWVKSTSASLDISKPFV